jgi:hypothetical protein
MRLFRLLPELMGLWTATEKKDAKAQLDAQFALVRAMEDQQAREEIAG